MDRFLLEEGCVSLFGFFRIKEASLHTLDYYKTFTIYLLTDFFGTKFITFLYVTFGCALEFMLQLSTRPALQKSDRFNHINICRQIINLTLPCYKNF